MRSDPASATVVTRKGSELLPAPVTPLWLTGVNAVVVPMPLLAVPPPVWLLKSGEKSVPPVAISVPQSPGVAPEGKSSNAASPEYAIWQLSSLPRITRVSGPPDPISTNGVCADAGGARSTVAVTASRAVPARSDMVRRYAHADPGVKSHESGTTTGRPRAARLGRSDPVRD